ncbi:hypothetical protein BD410DRAFT_783712 [Rickenella mellea]|uniref:UBX domain-containing protein n=1 Tax=Rickenella mellea TaxID=50990 RepID=A0A4Y7QG13_9AGAM|nr:hypothetical protein BD410DRAFT_783712 [Rickenella mellea]
MAGDKDTLISMGFDAARVEWALRATQNRGLQPAMDHLIEHEGEPVPDPSAQSATGGGSGGGSGGGGGEPMDEDEDEAEALRAAMGKASANIAPVASAGDGAEEGVEARSIKCSQCGKIFKNTALANFHAEKSGHDQFEESAEEIKPLTEEEKKQKLADLREKMAEKRSKKAVEELKENKANEAIKRKAGRDMGQIKEEMKMKEAIKAAEQAKRDKIEDAKAKAAIKAQIEADKRVRAEKAAREKALRDGTQIPSTPAAAASASSSTPATTGSGGTKEYKETRLQIRLARGGQPLTTTLPSESTLQDVAEFVAAQSLSVDVDTVNFAMHFPRKQFTRADFSKSLKDLGLTPSAVLIAS